MSGWNFWSWHWRNRHRCCYSCTNLCKKVYEFHNFTHFFLDSFWHDRNWVPKKCSCSIFGGLTVGIGTQFHNFVSSLLIFCTSYWAVVNEHIKMNKFITNRFVLTLNTFNFRIEIPKMKCIHLENGKEKEMRARISTWTSCLIWSDFISSFICLFFSFIPSTQRN